MDDVQNKEISNATRSLSDPFAIVARGQLLNAFSY
jgi:hypothetical protein